ncbi:MauE/DoxX family redox-associated membrane protein [Streptomyces sp. NPDC059788]|uniref:MauE/DoxX family redox-associated membrane protein n=1 Tax=Streptomyces sp. NPDC059788 TaxID=3346948 RepID=UPI00364E3D8F
MHYLAIAVRCLLVLVFLFSAVGKVAGRGRFSAFKTSLGSLRLLPPSLALPVAVAVVTAEWAVCVLLVVPATALAGSVAAAGLLAAFAAGVTVSVRRGIRQPCACFGPSGAPLGPRHVLRNVCLAGTATLGAVAALPDAPLHRGGVAIAMAGGSVLGLLVVALDDLLALFPSADAPPGAAGRRLRRMTAGRM